MKWCLFAESACRAYQPLQRWLFSAHSHAEYFKTLERNVQIKWNDKNTTATSKTDIHIVLEITPPPYFRLENVDNRVIEK